MTLNLFFTQTQKDGNRNIVVEVTPDLRKLILSHNRLRIKWFVIEARDHILVTRCFKCCGLGHRANTCPHNLTCSHCAKEHKFKDCKVKTDTTKIICTNCSAESKRTKNKHIDTKHSALSNDCPQLIRYKTAEFDRTDFGTPIQSPIHPTVSPPISPAL